MKLHPDWTAAAFKSLDTDSDGSLNEAEYEASVGVGPAETGSAAPVANNGEIAMVRKDGPASYIETAGPNKVLASALIGMRVYAVEADVDETKLYPAWPHSRSQMRT